MDGGIPKEIWTRKKVNYSQLKLFGCEAIRNIRKDHKTKLDDKSTRFIFLGYEGGDFGYRFRDLVKSKVSRSRDVIFN